MHIRSEQNLVLFNQHRELGYRCTWTGLTKMAVHELLTVCTSTEDVNKFREGFKYFFLEEVYCSEELACYLLQSACPKLPLDAANKEKLHLLYELFKKHGIETFTTVPSFKEVIHEILDIFAKSCDVNEVAKNVLLKIVTSYEFFDETREEYQVAISYLTEHRGVDVNALEESDFSSLLKFLQDKLLYLCCVYSTPKTSMFLHTKLDARKLDLIWANVLKYLPSNLCSGSVGGIRSFVTNGFDVNDALYRVDFSYVLLGDRSLQESFKDLLEIVRIFMDHGARLNPLPDSNEQPFLHGILNVHNEFFESKKFRPSLYGFITKCIRRGVDPKSTFAAGGMQEDLLCVVCGYYNASDKHKLIEYLCDNGAGASLYRNNGLDLWSYLSYRSRYELSHPRSNETLLLLLRKGLRTGCIDEYGNNVLHKYFTLYLLNIGISERCCLLRWIRSLDDLKFWDVLEALLDAGVSVRHANNDRVIPYQLFKAIMPRSNWGGVHQPLCSECCQKYVVEPLSSAHDLCVLDIVSTDVASIDVAPVQEAASILKASLSAAVNLEAQLTRLRKLMDRLLPSSHQPT